MSYCRGKDAPPTRLLLAMGSAVPRLSSCINSGWLQLLAESKSPSKKHTSLRSSSRIQAKRKLEILYCVNMCRGLDSLPITCLERAKELKARFGSFLLKQELNLMGLSNKNNKAKSDEALKWTTSFTNLLAHKDGLCVFRAFLVSEYSEENIAFYLACEDYKNTKSAAKLCSKAKKIYEEFIGPDAQREVNLDHETRMLTKKNLEQPGVSCFELAQSKIYTLMEKDCYPRFLKSALYLDLTRQLTP